MIFKLLPYKSKIIMNVSPVNISRKDNTNPKPMSKLLKAILIAALFLFSMDFGLIKSKSFTQKIPIKLASTFFGIGFFISAYLSISAYLTLRNIVWYLRYILQVYSSIIILFLMPENKTFCSFLNTLHCIDAKIGVDSDSFRLDIKILIYLVTSIMYKWVLSMLSCAAFIECIESIWLQLLYFIAYSSIDMPVIFLFFIFYAARCRLVALRKCIENGCDPIQFQNVYQSLIDATEIVKRAFDPIFCVTIIVDVPCIMIIIYQIIKDITVESSLNNVTGYATEAALVLSSLMVIFLPTIAAGSLTNEVNKIKICFHNMLLDEKDQQKEQDIQKLINYIDARPFKCKLLGVVPMDATLPTTILNLCVTYIIVVLQLTHLF